MKKFIVQETLVRSYTVEAESFDDAVAKASDMNDSEASSLDSQGFTYVYCPDNDTDLML